MTIGIADGPQPAAGRLHDASAEDHLSVLQGLPALHQQLRAAVDAATLFALAADLTRSQCGFTRALVVSVSDGMLTAAASGALEDPGSDRLRRGLLCAPLPITPGSLESALVRGRSGALARTSQLADALELVHHEIAPIAPEGRVLALLVVDRAEVPIDALDRATLVCVAAIIGVALEHVVLRARLVEASAELRHLTSSTQAMVTEILHSPVTVPAPRGAGYVFPHASLSNRCEATGVLTEREEQIAALLVEGRSNREIGSQLMISPETAKDYVARIRRKLNASNRVEAASRYLQLLQSR